jgi:hypothetical protein
MGPIRSKLIAGPVTLFIFASTTLEACPQCFVSSDNQVLNAYYVSVLFMALVPFGIVGSILAWLFIQKRRKDAAEVPQIMQTSVADFPRGGVD